MRAIVKSDLNIPVLACVAAGVEKFRVDLGDDGEGIVGPSQWEDQLQFRSRARTDAARNSLARCARMRRMSHAIIQPRKLMRRQC